MPDPLSDEFDTDALLRTAVPPSRVPPMTEEETERQRAGINPLFNLAREYFTPAQAMRNPDTPEARRAYAEALTRAHAAGGGKVPPLPGSEMFTPGQGMTMDLLSNVGPKALAAFKALAPAAKAIGAIHAGDPLSLGLIGGALHPSWISQRLPIGAKAIEDPLAAELLINPEAMRASPKAPQQKQTLWDRNVGLTRDYPNLSPQEKAAATTDELAGNFISHAADNIKWLYHQVPENIRGRSKLWYEGANRIAQGASDYFKVPLQSASAVYAALSPRKDWFMNVSIGDRLMYMHANHQNTMFSPEMAQKAAEIYAAPEFAPYMAKVSQNTLAGLDDYTAKAMWMRLYDEANHDPHYPIISPEGQRLGPALRKDGQQRVVVWASRSAMATAIKALESGGDRAAISTLMGEKHKVRNFYNNILDPHSPKGDVTIDTHAVAAALLRPLGLSNTEVLHNFGDAAAGSDITGVRGLYGLYAEAYRRAAKELGISPRELQSITWEAVRGLYPEEFKSAANNKLIDALWRSREQGASIDAIRQQILHHAGGINPPDWHGQPPTAGVSPAEFYGTLPGQ